MTSASIDMVRTNMRVSEVLIASQEVIERRSEIIGDALANPLSADSVELMRIVPEKVDALARIGLGMMADYVAAYDAWMSECRDLGAMMTRGRMPTAGEIVAQAGRSMNFAMTSAERAVRSQSKALRPVHKATTANARRLARKKTVSDGGR